MAARDQTDTHDRPMESLLVKSTVRSSDIPAYIRCSIEAGTWRLDYCLRREVNVEALTQQLTLRCGGASNDCYTTYCPDLP